MDCKIGAMFIFMQKCIFFVDALYCVLIEIISIIILLSSKILCIWFLQIDIYLILRSGVTIFNIIFSVCIQFLFINNKSKINAKKSRNILKILEAI